MRSILFGLAALALSCAHAFAQQPPVIHPGAQRLAHTVVTDSGLLEQAIVVVKKELASAVRQRLLSQPWAARLDEKKRQELDAFVDHFMDRATALIKELAPQIETAVAIAYSEDWTAEESSQIADFFASENGLALFKALTAMLPETYAAGGFPPAGLSANLVSSLTPDQMASVEAFSQSPAGKAFARVGFTRSKSIMSDSISNTMAQNNGTLVAELRNDLCAILGEPCPLR